VNKRLLRNSIVAGLSILALLFLYRTSVFRIYKNFHEVEPGQLYRSAQLTGAELDEIIQTYNIKSVVNLRGEAPGQWWYDDEKTVADMRGVSLYSVPLRDDEVPQIRHIVDLMEFLEKAPRPVLIHCRSGSDRTGEISALFTQEFLGWKPERAQTQLRFWPFLHAEVLRPAMDYFIRSYQGRDWLRNSYDPCSAHFADFYDQTRRCPSSTPKPST
jgi:protein tyrosine/serine phosphatase